MVLLNRRFIGFLFLFFLFFTVSSGVHASGQRLVVLHTNDHHGHPVAFPFSGEPAAGGLPARATLVEGIRDIYENVLLLDAGDINTGRPESNLFGGEPDILGYNFIGYDAVVIGNHEFDRGIEALQVQMGLADFSFLSANIRKPCGEYFSQPYLIKHFDGFAVAVFGLTTVATTAITHPAHIAGLRFEDEVKTARSLVPKLREKADVVIALVHMGIYDTGRGSMRLAAEVPGIDLVVDGHSHSLIHEPVQVKNRSSGVKVPVVQAWKWGLVVGRVDLDVLEPGTNLVSFEVIPVNLPGKYTAGGVSKLAQNRKLLDILDVYSRKVDKMLSAPVAYVPEPVTHRDGRRAETILGSLVADSMMWAASGFRPDFAVQNAGGIRDDIPKGTLTARIVHRILPFDNTVSVVELPGRSVMSLMAHMAEGAASDGKGFPQVSAEVEMFVDRRTGRVVDASIAGRPIDAEGIYRVATNSYLAAGGDGYRVFSESGLVQDTSICQREALTDYIRHLGPRLSLPRAEARIKFVR